MRLIDSRAVSIAFPLVACLLIPGCQNDSSNPVSPSGGKIRAGSSSVLYSGTVSPAGGTTVVRKPGDSLNGLTITIPGGAFSATRSLTIASAPIESHQFGPDFQPVTPYITINPGSVYAELPVSITIPVRIPKNHFAMPVAYNPSTDQLEPLPVIGLTDTSITTYLGDFASGTSAGGLLSRVGLARPGGEIEFLLGLVVSVIATEVLDLDADYQTGFSPEADDWQFTNWGSCVAPRGHCAGQSIAMMWYFNNKFKKGAPALFGLYDNDGQTPRTPTLWQDDVLGYKFCSVVQNDAHWDNIATTILELFQLNPLGDIVTLKLFSYAMRLNHTPQFAAIYGYDGSKRQGHAMIVYRQNKRELYVADPNYPGDRTRRIRFNNATFTPYASGPNASQLGVQYDGIYFYRYQSPVFNWNAVSDRWKEFENKTIGAGKFPSYSVWVLDDSGKFVPMADGFKSEENDLTLSIRPASSQLKFQAFSEAAVKLPVAANTVTLPSGKQRVGICVVDQQDKWAGFNWYAVEMGAEAPTDTSTIFPLATGNSWTYFQQKYRSDGTRYDTLTYTVSIVDAQFIQTEKWFLVLDSRAPAGDTLFIRRKDDGMWVYPKGSPYPEFLLFKYPAAPGESYGSGVDGLTQMSILGTTLVRTVPAGTFTPCYEYKQATLGRTDYNKRILSPGIGEVESSTYSQKTGGGEYLSVFSQLRSYILK